MTTDLLTAADARIYRCTGCGEWRYRWRLGRWHCEQGPCDVCMKRPEVKSA